MRRTSLSSKTFQEVLKNYLAHKFNRKEFTAHEHVTRAQSRKLRRTKEGRTRNLVEQQFHKNNPIYIHFWHLASNCDLDHGCAVAFYARDACAVRNILLIYEEQPENSLCAKI